MLQAKMGWKNLFDQGNVSEISFAFDNCSMQEAGLSIEY